MLHITSKHGSVLDQVNQDHGVHASTSSSYRAQRSQPNAAMACTACCNCLPAPWRQCTINRTQCIPPGVTPWSHTCSYPVTPSSHPSSHTHLPCKCNLHREYTRAPVPVPPGARLSSSACQLRFKNIHRQLTLRSIGSTKGGRSDRQTDRQTLGGARPCIGPCLL